MDYNTIYRDSDGFVLRFGYAEMTAGTGETLRTDAPKPTFSIYQLDPAGKAHKWNDSSWVLAVPPALPDVGSGIFNSGTYTGNGEVAMDVLGVGFKPRYVKIEVKNTITGTACIVYESWAEVLADDPAGMCIFHRPASSPPHAVVKDAIKSFDVDGFTVGDQGAGEHPNQNAIVYHWYAIG